MWLEPFRRFWSQRLDALATELARGKRERRAKNDTHESDPDRATDEKETTDD